jgi:hypothetical protein
MLTAHPSSKEYPSHLHPHGAPCASPLPCFENRFRDVVLISSVEILDMQVEFSFLHERLQNSSISSACRSPIRGTLNSA